MIKSSDLLELVYESLDSVNELLSDEEQIPKKSDIKLTGSDGLIDSLGLTSLILEIESNLKIKYGIDLDMMDSIVSSEGFLADIETPLSIANLIEEKISKNEN